MDPSNEPRIQLVELELLTNNPGPFREPLRWRVRIDVSEALQEPMSVSFVWVGSARSSEFDQVLDTFDCGPFVPGITEFQLECDAPALDAIPREDLLGVTVLLMSFQYRAEEFLRVGYYTQVAYFDETLNEAPPAVPNADALGRFVLMNQPAVTILPISWDSAFHDPLAG